jgi:hypothetical protein
LATKSELKRNETKKINRIANEIIMKGQEKILKE